MTIGNFSYIWWPTWDSAQEIIHKQIVTRFYKTNQWYITTNFEIFKSVLKKFYIFTIFKTTMIEITKTRCSLKKKYVASISIVYFVLYLFIYDVNAITVFLLNYS